MLPSLRKVDHPLRDDASIANYDDGFWRDLLQLSPKLVVVLDLFRLDDWQVQLECGPLYRRGRYFHAAATGAVRLGHDQLHAETCRNQLFQRGHGERRGAAKHQVHHGRATIRPAS